jgi:pimeloyl-ACP methyl ester carboxylesterase
LRSRFLCLHQKITPKIDKMSTPKQFQVNISDNALELLKTKLDNVRWPNTHPDGWTENQGVPLDTMTSLVSHWKTSYLPRWRERETAINRLPMYQLSVDAGDFGTLNVHFLWRKAERSGAVPLLFLHGWPGCFLEAQKILDPLANGENDGPFFDVVAPSLPNFGFSDGVQKVSVKIPGLLLIGAIAYVRKKGFHIGNYAMVMHNLMTALGYDQYVIQGGDWGSMISRQQAKMYPESVKAVHVNLVALRYSNLLRSPLTLLKFLLWPWTAAERKGLISGRRYVSEGSGYYSIQSTRPLTVAYCLADSPVALLAWVSEKIREWSADQEKSWTNDELLDWVSIYWFSTAGPGASVAVYYEAEAGIQNIGGSYWEWQPAPLGVTQFPGDFVGMPSAVIRLLGRVVFERWADYGGHFAAWEAPSQLINDLRTMFGKNGGAYGVVDGYGERKKDL